MNTYGILERPKAAEEENKLPMTSPKLQLEHVVQHESQKLLHIVTHSYTHKRTLVASIMFKGH